MREISPEKKKKKKSSEKLGSHIPAFQVFTDRMYSLIQVGNVNICKFLHTNRLVQCPKC